MGAAHFHLHDRHEQVKLVDDSVHDVRPTISTGFDGMDRLLRRGGLLPGTFTLLGGRTGTRKSTIMENMIVSMMEADVPVALLGLDEPPWLYMLKLLSVWSGQPMPWLEENWDEDEGKELQRAWKARAGGTVHLVTGRRLALEHLDATMDMATVGSARAPAVIFIDFLGLLTREGSFGYGEGSRLPLLAEELQLWSTDTGVAIVALHQLSRNDEHGGSNSRNAGHIPVTLSQLMYGGEAAADHVFGAYRPTLNPLAAMKFQVAQEVMGERFDEDAYFEVKAIAAKYKNSTFLQLLKNRPGTMTDPEGIELRSPTDSLRMEEKPPEVKSAEREEVRAASA